MGGYGPYVGLAAGIFGIAFGALLVSRFDASAREGRVGWALAIAGGVITGFTLAMAAVR